MPSSLGSSSPGGPKRVIFKDKLWVNNSDIIMFVFLDKREGGPLINKFSGKMEREFEDNLFGLLLGVKGSKARTGLLAEMEMVGCGV